MKWFKHISDSAIDPFITDLIHEFGLAGHAMFFIIVEIYAREFKAEPGWKLDISLHYLMKIMDLTRRKKLINFLCSPKILKKWDVVLDDDRVTIYIPKFVKLLDDTTMRKLRAHEQKFGQSSDKVRTKDKDKDKDKDKEKKIQKEKPPPRIIKAKHPPDFLEFWRHYPIKKSKTYAFQAWKKLKSSGSLPELSIIIEAIKNQKQERIFLNTRDAFVPEWKHPSTWLNQNCWEDEAQEIERKPNKAEARELKNATIAEEVLHARTEQPKRLN